MPVFAPFALSLALSWLSTQASAAGDDSTIATASVPIRLDRFDRYQTEVMLNGKGPFRFIIDTGSAYSVVSDRAAGLLGLRPDARVDVLPAGGQSFKGVLIEDYRSGVFDRRDEPMIVYPTYAEGMMGMRPFVSGRIEIEFASRRLVFGRSGAMPAGFLAQRGSLSGTSNLIVDVVVDGVHAKALVDTGARYTIGNPALQAALGFAADDPRLRRDEPMPDFSAQPTPAWKTRLRGLTIGDAAFPSPLVRFADVQSFHRLGLDEGPALILGIDQLSRMHAIAIDYPKVELQLLPSQR